jgi:uncharacterized protein YndB with AHSA1/START domain
MSSYTAARTGKYPVKVTLPNDLEIHITREFDAPRGLVFRVCTEPEHLRQWWGPAFLEMIVCEMDVRTGGKWRIVQRMPDGQEHGFHGEYLDVIAPERVVKTFIYEPFPQHGAVETATWNELPSDRTLFTTIVRHKTKEGRDGHVNSGLEGGMTESCARLEVLLEQLT